MFPISTSLFTVLNTRRLLEEGFNFQSPVSKQKFSNNIFRQALKDLIFATELAGLTHNNSLVLCSTNLVQSFKNYTSKHKVTY